MRVRLAASLNPPLLFAFVFASCNRHSDEPAPVPSVEEFLPAVPPAAVVADTPRVLPPVPIEHYSADVPAIAPDTIPAWVFLPEYRVKSLQPCAFLEHTTGVILVTFSQGTTQEQKESAIRSVKGRVIGGSEFAGTDGTYFLFSETGRDGGEAICRATDTLSNLPHVLMAAPISFGGFTVM